MPIAGVANDAIGADRTMTACTKISNRRRIVRKSLDYSGRGYTSNGGWESQVLSSDRSRATIATMERFEIVLACPSCHVGARLTAFEPDDTDQAITWTDGYREIAGVPPPLQVARCCACNAFYWTDMATPVLEPLPADAVAEIEALDENSYYVAIDRVLGSDHQRELAL